LIQPTDHAVEIRLLRTPDGADPEAYRRLCYWSLCAALPTTALMVTTADDGPPPGHPRKLAELVAHDAGPLSPAEARGVSQTISLVMVGAFRAYGGRLD